MNTEGLIEAAVEVDIQETAPMVDPDIEVVPAIEPPAATVPAVVAPNLDDSSLYIHSQL